MEHIEEVGAPGFWIRGIHVCDNQVCSYKRHFEEVAETFQIQTPSQERNEENKH